MTDDNQTPPRRFTIRRLSPGETPPTHNPPPNPPKERQAAPTQSTPAQKPSSQAQKPASQPKKPASKPPTPPPPSVVGTATAGRFRSAGAVLAFLSSVLNTSIAEEATVRQTPDRSWWVEVPVPHSQVTPLVWASGGRPFTNWGNEWVAVALASELPSLADAHQDARQYIDASNWAVVDLATLLAQVSLLPGRYSGATLLDVMVPTALSRWVLRRATALGLSVTILPMSRQPLAGGCPPDSGILLLRLQAPAERRIPAALVYSLTRLPYAIVGEPQEAEGKTFMVDVRHRFPLVPTLVQAMIPQGEYWLLGPLEAGHWRLQATGQPINGNLLLDPTALEVPEVPVLPAAPLPPPLPVQLVRRPSAVNRVDAVLLDELELKWLYPFLRGRPIGEAAFLLPGPGFHLLTAPGGLPGLIPFGVPLVQVGPGALYLELGSEFSPPLPDSARQQRFQLDEQHAVIITHTGVYRFATRDLTPAWSLWVGEAPPVQTGLSPSGQRFLNALSRELRQAAASQAEPPPKAPQPVTRSQRVQLLEQAQRAELAGNLIQAAELLERAGQPGPAGRLYERAARNGAV